MIEIKNLTKIYKTKKEDVIALNQIDLKLQEKGMIFFVGKSGSGKSTLLNVLGGLDKITSGEILINETPLTQFTQSEMDSYRNLHIGFIFQEYNLLNEFTVKENIGLAMELQGEKVSDEKLREVLDKVGIKEEYLTRKPNQLSGGERQRIAIARALIKNPDILMADEPTGALNSELGASTFELLKELSKDKLVLIVSHDMESAKLYGDRIIELSDGKIISDKEYVKKEEKAEIIFGEDKISFTEDYELTPQDLEKMNEYIKLNQGVKEIIVERTQNKELKDTNIETISSVKNDLTLKKAKLPIISAAKIGLHNFLSKKFRLIITVILSVFAFTCLGVAHSLGTINLTKVEVPVLYEAGYEYFAMRKVDKESETNSEKFNAYDIKHIEEKLDTNIKEFYGGVALTYNRADLNYNRYSLDYTYSSRFTTISQEDLDYFGFDLYGNLPKDETNEVVITDYMYQTFKTKGYLEDRDIDKENIISINSKDDLIGKTIKIYDNNQKIKYTYVIVGILDTHFDLTKHEKILEYAKNPSGTNYKERDKAVSEFYYESVIFHSTIFIPENKSVGYFEEKKFTALVVGKMPTTKSGINRLVKYSNTFYSIQGHNIELRNSLDQIPIIQEIESLSMTMENSFVRLFVVIGMVFAIFSYVLLSNFISQSIEIKQKEIGIFRALGARKLDILKLFSCESLMIGMIILPLSFIGTIIINAKLNNYAKRLLRIEFNMIFANFTQVFLLTFIISACVLMATYFAVNKFVSETPMEAIKKKK